jgi:DNA-binding response OmpR family regulator
VRSLIKDEAPDLLLLDVMLPDGNGFEVLGKIRRHPKFSSLPIIMLTAASEPSDIGKGLALGADGYVIKPYSKNIINAVILKVLNG